MVSYTSSWVMNFANSVVGVGVLAMPFCFEKCGLILASVMLLTTGFVTKKTCEFLLKASIQTRKATIEQIGFHLFGDVGKLCTEVGIIGLLAGTLVAFQVVIGDLAPSIVSNNLGFEKSWSLRTVLMVCSSCVILPLTLMKNISSLAALNAISISFYGIFICIIGLKCFPVLVTMEWISQVNMWNTGAIFQCMPIICMSFTCQMQILVMYAAIPDPTIKGMMDIVDKAVNLVCGIYILTGTFGYITYYKQGIQGNVMENFPPGFLADLIKLGFWSSVIISFPLIAFPVRAALNSLLFLNKQRGVLQDMISSASDYIAPELFTYISFGLVSSTLITGVLIPKIEMVLSVTGALVGTTLCFVVPALFYLSSGAIDGQKKLAQSIFIVSVSCTVFSTISVLSTIASPDQQQEPFVAQRSAQNGITNQQLLNKAAMGGIPKGFREDSIVGNIVRPIAVTDLKTTKLEMLLNSDVLQRQEKQNLGLGEKNRDVIKVQDHAVNIDNTKSRDLRPINHLKRSNIEKQQAVETPALSVKEKLLNKLGNIVEEKNNVREISRTSQKSHAESMNAPQVRNKAKDPLITGKQQNQNVNKGTRNNTENSSFVKELKNNNRDLLNKG